MPRLILPFRPSAFSARRAVPRLAPLLAALALAGCGLLQRAPAPAPAAALPNPQVLLLGEVHDNPQGHRQRFEELKRRVDAGWRPAIAMEQFDRENQALLSKAQKECPDADCVIRVMDGPRWEWALYRPVIDLALRYQLPLVAANLSRADASRTVRDGVRATFDAAAVQAYGLAAALPDDIRAAQQREIIAGHCNMLPESMVGGMVEAQIARDVWMAKTVLAQAPRDVVLLAGNGHVRNDIGVPRWIARAAPGLTVRSVAYLEKGGAGPAGAYDAAQIVAPRERPDPCAKFK